MTTTRTYASPAAFKQALEQRLRAASSSGADWARRRQLLVFDRFLARVIRILGDAATLKGGLVLDLERFRKFLNPTKETRLARKGRATAA